MASFYNDYYRYYKPYSSTNFKKPISNNDDCSIENKSSNNFNSNPQKKSSRYYSFGPIQFKNPIFDNINSPIFEILGIQLYLDDIIILGLLFFLYQEGVQDEMLYIALILLLLG